MYNLNIFFLNIYMHVLYLYIHNKYTQYTHIMQTKTFILDAINRLTALIYYLLYLTLDFSKHNSSIFIKSELKSKKNKQVLNIEFHANVI